MARHDILHLADSALVVLSITPFEGHETGLN